MSAVTIACPGCGVRLTLKNQDKLGKKIKCPKCGGVFVARPVEEQQPVPDDDGWLSDFGDVGMDDPDHGRDPRPKQKASGDSRQSSKKKSPGKKRAAATRRGPGSQRKLMFAGIGGGVVVVAVAIWAIVAVTGNRNDDKPNNENVAQNDGDKTGGPGTPSPDGNQPGEKQNGNSVPPTKKTPAGPKPNKTTNENENRNENKTPPAKKPRTQETLQQVRTNLDAVVREIRNARNLDDQQRAGLVQRTATAVKKTQELLAKKQPGETDFIPPLYSCATMLRDAQGQAVDDVATLRLIQTIWERSDKPGGPVGGYVAFAYDLLADRLKVTKKAKPGELAALYRTAAATLEPLKQNPAYADTLTQVREKLARLTDAVAVQPKKPANKLPGKVNGRLDNNLKCVDLSDLTGPLPLNVLSSRKILSRSEFWEYSTWTLVARKDDTVGYPSMVHNDRGENPDGKYYLYYAHHDPTSGIACAIADSVEGPYRKLAKLDADRKHSQVLVNPHFPGRLGDPSHYSSPSVVWNEDEKLWFMYFHYYNHFHRLWEEHAAYPGGGNQMTALATSPDLSSHNWTIVEDEGTDKVNMPKIMPVLATTKKAWMYGTSSYHAFQRLPTGEWLAFLRGTDAKGACSVGFARSRDGRKWSLFPENPMIRPRSGRDAALGIYRPGFIGYLGKDSAGKHRYLVVWAESRKGADVPRIRYGYTTDFVKIIPDRRGFANWPGGDGLISTWRVDDKLYLFAAKYLHVMNLPVASN
ncbi:MAG: hypothetical protein VB861_18410 [Planctomycetaceae bacterium]